MLKKKSESSEQMAFVDWLTAKRIVHFAISNENLMSFVDRKKAIIIAAKLKKMGRKKGVPDLAILLPNKMPLFIEMKKEDGGVLSQDQKWWRDTLLKYGYFYEECHGCMDAISAVYRYLGR